MVHQPDVMDGFQHSDAHAPPSNVHLGASCENHIDRLVRERLEQNYSQRTSLKKTMAAANAHSWSLQGRFEQLVQSTFLCTLQMPGTVFGKAYDSGAQCSKTVIKALPQVVNDDSDGEDDYAGRRSAPQLVPRHQVLQQKDDEFRDIIATPVASRLASRQEHIDTGKLATAPGVEGGANGSSRVASAAVMPSGLNKVPLPKGADPTSVAPLTSADAEEDGVGPLPNVQRPARNSKASRGGRRSGDTASALSVSSTAMTSSAASLLGGFSQPGKVGGNSSQGTRRKNSEERSVIGGAASSSVAPSVIAESSVIGGSASSSANASTSATAVPQEASATASLVGGGKRGDGAAGPKKRVPKGDSKTVISGFNSNSSSQASALLGGLMQQNQGKKKTSKSDRASVM